MLRLHREGEERWASTCLPWATGVVWVEYNSVEGWVIQLDGVDHRRISVTKAEARNLIRWGEWPTGMQ